MSKFEVLLCINQMKIYNPWNVKAHPALIGGGGGESKYYIMLFLLLFQLYCTDYTVIHNLAHNYYYTEKTPNFRRE